MISAADLRLLRCPICRGGLAAGGAVSVPPGSRLTCRACAARFDLPAGDGWPRLYQEDEVQGSDRLLRGLYDRLARLHDPAVRATLPLFGAGREDDLRAAYLDRLALDQLAAETRRRPAGRPLRLLDVGVGTGADLPALQARLARALGALENRPVEIWGLDLSLGMLGRCRARVQRARLPGVRLLVADAHALPFADGVFDRVFQVGAMNGFRDPGRVLAEMTRVARPGSPLLVVDERLDPGRDHGLLQRALFRAITFYEVFPHCPTELLPGGARDVRVEQVSRFFYCLTWRRPRPQPRRGARDQAPALAGP